MPEKDYDSHKYRREIKDSVAEKVVKIEGNSLSSREELDQLKDKIMDETEGMGAMLYLATKCIPFAKDVSQEQEVKKFFLSNSIAALSSLGTGGNFVIKLYDCLTPWTVSLIYILYLNFESISIVKPYSHRGHSPSRYLVCNRLIEENSPFIAYLTEIMVKSEELAKQDKVLG